MIPEQVLLQKPLPTNSVLSVQVLHALLHNFDHFMKTAAVHLKAHVFDWTESPSSHNMRFLKQAKEEIQNSIYQATGIKGDYPDSTGKRWHHHQWSMFLRVFTNRLYVITPQYSSLYGDLHESYPKTSQKSINI